ncbi:hypothetical protein BDR03DRAFT_964640 [Suillus americanus]|nr:hypothetical protein BDR03DRAFT_964640 [Suillus americanus]
MNPFDLVLFLDIVHHLHIAISSLSLTTTLTLVLAGLDYSRATKNCPRMHHCIKDIQH